jgi:hypothetical protein
MNTTAADFELTNEDMPLSNGVDWRSGETLPALAASALGGVDEDAPSVRHRADAQIPFGLTTAEIDDPNDLMQAGWGVVFGSDVKDEVKAGLKPLLEHRAEQAKPFKVFDGLSGHRKGESTRQWLERHGVGLATVNPSAGVPFYLLIVASPDDIPFEFQYLLDAYWAVGRLHFDSVEAYGRYAERVVDYEKGATVPTAKTVGVFAPRNDGDRPTGFLFNQLARPLTEGTQHLSPLGQKQGFKLREAIGEKATKDELRAMLKGTGPSGRPAFLFSGSHGAYADAKVPQRLDRIGALVTQDWGGPGSPLSESCSYSAADMDKDDLDCGGLIHFFFACYSAGCPQFDSYTREPDGTKRHLVDDTLVARLPQRMLQRGALAVLGHMDRAFSYSFQNSRLTPQIQDMRDVMVALLKGWRVGRATDQFNMRWTVLSAELSDALRDRRDETADISDPSLANRWIARDDARNHVILGDPAVRLRVEAMA